MNSFTTRTQAFALFEELCGCTLLNNNILAQSWAIQPKAVEVRDFTAEYNTMKNYFALGIFPLWSGRRYYFAFMFIGDTLSSCTCYYTLTPDDQGDMMMMTLRKLRKRAIRISFTFVCSRPCDGKYPNQEQVCFSNR